LSEMSPPVYDVPMTAAPYFSLARAAWIAYAVTWDPETGALRGVEGPRGFASYREAVEAIRFLMAGEPLSRRREESAC
jgi:hypothetical protein